MSLVPVWPGVRLREKAVTPLEDLPVVDHVVRAWMRYHGVQKGDRIQACYVEVDCMHDPTLVWVVVGPTGLVLSISQPPIGVVLPAGPTAIYLVSETA